MQSPIEQECCFCQFNFKIGMSKSEIEIGFQNVPTRLATVVNVLFCVILHNYVTFQQQHDLTVDVLRFWLNYIFSLITYSANFLCTHAVSKNSMVMLVPYTVEPPKRGHFGIGTFVLSSEVVPISEVHHILISYHLYNV